MFCPKCGNENRDDVRFCYKCGFDLTQSAPPESRADSRPVRTPAPGSPSSDGTDSVGALPSMNDSDEKGKRLGPRAPVVSMGAVKSMPEDEDHPDDAEGGSNDSESPASGFDAHGNLSKGALVAGRYRIERKLGQGGMGAVYLARDEKMDESIAIKFISPSIVANDAIIKRFLAEAKICFRLTHPNIVRVHHFDEWVIEEKNPYASQKPIQKKYLYLTMEYVDGMALDHVIETLKAKSKPLTWAQIFAMLSQILDSVEYAHRQGVLHRDLKPANIMLANLPGGGQCAKVMDFGLAKILGVDGMTKQGKAMGTPYYMAPEQRQNAAVVDARADVFSIGVIAYELMTLELPIGSFEPPSHLRADLPPGVDAWVSRATARDVAKRFASTAKMCQELKSLSSAAPAPQPSSSAISTWSASTTKAQAQTIQPARQSSKSEVEAWASLKKLKVQAKDKPHPRQKAMYASFTTDWSGTEAANEAQRALRQIEETVKREANERKEHEEEEQRVEGTRFHIKPAKKSVQVSDEEAHLRQECHDAITSNIEALLGIPREERTVNLHGPGPFNSCNRGKWRRAAELGIQDGMYFHAHFLEEERDSAGARQWLERAASGGHLMAKIKLGELSLDNGDSARGLTLLKEAANAGSALACNVLSRRYENGEGVPISMSDYHKWLQRAARLGSRRAELFLECVKLIDGR
ncbi:MAG: protein kinase [Candidatus Sumerlaeota bacterium]|nr:protein kinase [Candidatus Sumerlaeota bacterium]